MAGVSEGRRTSMWNLFWLLVGRSVLKDLIPLSAYMFDVGVDYCCGL